MPENPNQLYDKYYYDHYSYSPYERDSAFMPFFASIAEHIIQEINPKTVLDAGCAKGFLVENLRKRGIEAFGIDISEYAIQNVHPEIAPFCRVGSILDPLPQYYDLIVSLEVVEHLPSSEAGKIINNFCEHVGNVLFSSTPDEFKDATHFNVQPPEYWAELFAYHSFYRDVDYDANYIAPWAVRFRKLEEPTARIIRGYERKYWQMAKEVTALRSLSTEQYQKIDDLSRATQGLAAEQAGRQAQSQLEAIQNSRTWKMLMWIDRFRMGIFPPGSRRERWMYKLTGKS
jgi:SAM-dependent methyltransferase